jgi:hypothetical protein
MAYQTSQGLASLGRNGDSVLVHMNPTEVAGLQGLAMSQGGSLTINPHTGLPEAFSLGGFFKSLLPMFVGAATGGAGMPLWAGIAAGAATGAATSKDPLMGALTGGLGGYGGYGLGQGLAAAGAAPGAATIAPAGGYVPGTVEGANTALNVAGTYNPALSPATTNAVNAMNASGFVGSAGTGATGIDKSFLGGMDRIGPGIKQMGTGFKNIATGQEGAFDAFKNSFVSPGGKPLSDLAAYGKIAMPIGGAALGGLEPSDIYGEPINMDEAKKKQAYNPNATLNLSGDTGLRLYATGGTIQSGGIRDLYGTPDNQPTISPGLSGFGLGRLNNLAGEQAMTQAQTLGYAEGGDIEEASTGMNLDALPSLNLNTGTSSLGGSSGMGGYGNDKLYMVDDRAAMSPVGRMFLSQMSQSDRAKFIGSGMGAWFGIKEAPKQEYYTGSGALTSRYGGSGPQQRTGDGKLISSGYAMGGPVSFADGGDSNKEDAMGLSSLTSDMSMSPNAGADNSAMIQSVMGAAQPTQDMQGSTTAQGQMPDQTNDSLIAQVTANLRADPNYQPKNSIEASIVNQIKGTDSMQQGEPSLQGLGSIAPSQPMAPSYNPSVAMGPTYYAGMNAPRGMARGGYLNGQGDGMSDSIPATIEGKQPARLADGEFVIPADVVSHIGNGSSKAGSKRLYAMLDKVRKARTGHTKQGKQIKPEKYMPA